MPPIKLGASKWRFEGAVGFVGTVLEEMTDVAAGVVSVGWVVEGVVVGENVGLVVLVVGVETEEPKITLQDFSYNQE